MDLVLSVRVFVFSLHSYAPVHFIQMSVCIHSCVSALESPQMVDLNNVDDLTAESVTHLHLQPETSIIPILTMHISWRQVSILDILEVWKKDDDEHNWKAGDEEHKDDESDD